MLQLDDNMVMGQAAQRSFNEHGKISGSYDDNPFLNSIIYDVDFPDGQVKEYGTSILVENMSTQVDCDGYSLTLLDAIIDHCMNLDVAVTNDDKYLIMRSRQKRLRKMTKG